MAARKVVSWLTPEAGALRDRPARCARHAGCAHRAGEPPDKAQQQQRHDKAAASVGGLLAGASFAAGTAAQFAEPTNAVRANGSGRRSSAHWPRRRHTAGVPLRSATRSARDPRRACAGTRRACANSSTRRVRAGSECRSVRSPAPRAAAEACSSELTRGHRRRSLAYEYTSDFGLEGEVISPLADCLLGQILGNSHNRHRKVSGYKQSTGEDAFGPLPLRFAAAWAVAFVCLRRGARRRDIRT
jgi:hypothetical protein